MPLTEGCAELAACIQEFRRPAASWRADATAATPGLAYGRQMPAFMTAMTPWKCRQLVRTKAACRSTKKYTLSCPSFLVYGKSKPARWPAQSRGSISVEIRRSSVQGLISASEVNQSINFGLLKDGKTHLRTKVWKSTKYKIYDNVRKS